MAQPLKQSQLDQVWLAYLGNVVTINPNNLLDSAQGYYVQIAASGFDDVAGNSFVGINDATTLNFTAADVAGPTLSSSTPADDATGVAVDANIVLTFNENVVAGSGNITLKKSSDNSTVEAMAVGGANVSISGTTVTINPTANLDSSEDITFKLTPPHLMMRVAIPTQA